MSNSILMRQNGKKNVKISNTIWASFALLLYDKLTNNYIIDVVKVKLNTVRKQRQTTN